MKQGTHQIYTCSLCCTKSLQTKQKCITNFNHCKMPKYMARRNNFLNHLHSHFCSREQSIKQHLHEVQAWYSCSMYLRIFYQNMFVEMYLFQMKKATLKKNSPSIIFSNAKDCRIKVNFWANFWLDAWHVV